MSFLKYFFSIFFLAVLTGGVSLGAMGDPWSFPGLTIIGRDQRGANPAWLYDDYASYQPIRDGWKKSADELVALSGSDPVAYQKKIKAQELSREISKTRNEYLVDNFPNEVLVDKTVTGVNGKEFWWNQSYKEHKDRIVVHHTVTDGSQLTTREAIVNYLKGTAYFHTFTRGWGDIGYNFLIDPAGKIYEGRAGGEGVIAAHAAWNNASSIGISLMGNFEVEKPTAAQLESLIVLSTELAKKYHIDPFKKITWHKESATAPYISNVTDFSLIGHRDCGTTSCPGKFLYEKLDFVRTEVKKRAGSQLINQPFVSEASYYFDLPQISLDDQIRLSVPLQNGKDGSCLADSPSYAIVSCNQNGNFFEITVKKLKNLTSGRKRISLKKNDGSNFSVIFSVLWKSDVTNLLTIRKNNYKEQFGFQEAQSGSTKISTKIPFSRVAELEAQKVKVLLYELTTKSQGWSMVCENGCTVSFGSRDFLDAHSVSVEVFNGYLRADIDGMASTGAQISVAAGDGKTVDFPTYQRKSYAGIARNRFYGAIHIVSQSVKLKNGGLENRFAVINELPFDLYMRGLAEIADADHPEKHKVMALLTKGYALFYLSQENKHPSLPQGVLYNAVDDPDIFQKYVGAGADKTFKNWKKALDATTDQVLLYRGYLPILPYYSCSAGFIWSAQEKWGWIDTPYLQSRLDFSQCGAGKDFQGHGVGLSGKGAQFLADHGYLAQQIIDWYYPGVEARKLP